MSIIALKIVYIANILVAGWISYTSLLYPKTAAQTVFQGAYPDTEVIRLVGSLWLGITVLSVLGLWRPITFSPVLLMQVIYKGSWLLIVALPAIRAGIHYPKGMAGFFLVWVLVLPFVIPWKIWGSAL
ncbi:MAG: hypothetical protein AB8F95_16955 [Bacteroidia bacterium]